MIPMAMKNVNHRSAESMMRVVSLQFIIKNEKHSLDHSQ